jgi:F-type H+-transporting ATPase subunit epsilon
VAGTLVVQVVSAQSMVHEGNAAALVAPAWDGEVGILPGHAAMITLLGEGMLTLDQVGGGSSSMYVAGGVLKVEDDRVTVLAEFSSPSAPEGGPPPGVVPDMDALLEGEDEDLSYS